MAPANWSRRKDTVRNLYLKLNYYMLIQVCIFTLVTSNWSLKFFQVRGTPASGKTTLLHLLWAYILTKDPNAAVIPIFDWNIDKQIDGFARLRRNIPGFPTPTKKTYLLFDNGEGTYLDASLWDYFFKRHKDFDNYRTIIFCSYGSAKSQPLRYNPGTPVNLESVARVTLVCDDKSEDEFGKVELLLSPDEFKEIIRRRKLAVADDLQDRIFSWTGGHVGAVIDILEIISRQVSFLNSSDSLLEFFLFGKARAQRDELGLQGKSLDLQILTKLFSFESFWGTLVKSGTWTCGLPVEQLHEPERAEMFKDLLKFGFIADTSSSNTVRYCHQRGWIYAIATQTGVVYVLPSPLHRAYYEWKLLPSSTEFKFTTLLDLSTKVIQAFQPSQLSVPPQRVGVSGAVLSPEAAYQDEFYRSIFSITNGCVRVSSEFSSAKGARSGRIDFFIPSAKWGIELLRNGNNIEEHASRFHAQGAYGPWLKSSDMSDYIILDFRTTRPKKPHKRKFSFHSFIPN